MRTIRFRAKSIVNDKHNNIKVGDFVFGHYIESGCDAPCIIFGDGEQIEIDKLTLGQFIGLTDRNDKDLYEGDLVSPLNKGRCGDYVVASIKFVGGAFVASTLKSNWHFHGINCSDHKIVGTIYDNESLISEN